MQQRSPALPFTEYTDLTASKSATNFAFRLCRKTMSLRRNPCSFSGVKTRFRISIMTLLAPPLILERHWDWTQVKGTQAFWFLSRCQSSSQLRWYKLAFLTLFTANTFPEVHSSQKRTGDKERFWLNAVSKADLQAGTSLHIFWRYLRRSTMGKATSEPSWHENVTASVTANHASLPCSTFRSNVPRVIFLSLSWQMFHMSWTALSEAPLTSKHFCSFPTSSGASFRFAMACSRKHQTM